MHSALTIARRGLGRVAPNPSVGCVIVKNGVVVGRARTADGGRPHAETIAMAQAAEQAEGATVYVTLEPCAHEGKTPPCADALIEARVARVVIACTDPDPRTAGRGIVKMRENGIDVEVGALEYEAQLLNKGFFLNLSEQRPYITLKTATSADEKVYGAPGRWITGPVARARAHLLRARNDAILIGSGTALADDPLLTTRVPGLVHHSVRVVADRRLRLKPDSHLVQSASVQEPVIIWHGTDKEVPDYLNREGITLMAADTLKAGLSMLAQRGVTRLLVEGGPAIHSAFIHEGLHDCLYWFKAPLTIGAHGLPALEKESFHDISEKMDLTGSFACGEDVLEIYRRKE